VGALKTPAELAADHTAVGRVCELASAYWMSLGKVAEKEAKRDDLVDGKAYPFEGKLLLSIDGESLVQKLSGKLTVGHASTKNASVTPKLPEVLALILLSIAPKKRAELLNAIAVNCESAGCLYPSPPAALVAEATEFLARLRTTKQETVRGPVKAEYSLK
jgi:hypothetical protein